MTVIEHNNDFNLRKQLSALITALEDAQGYALTFAASAGSPADSTAYYVGDVATLPPSSTSATDYAVTVPRAGTITAAHVLAFANGVAGDNTSWSLHVRLNNTTDTLIAAVVSANARRVFSNAALSIVVAAGDTLILKTTTPAWVTNPTNVIWSGVLYIR